MSHQVVAVHEIHQTVKPGVAKTKDTKAQRPETKIVKPGTSFVIDDDDEYDRLKGNGAIRDYGTAENAKTLVMNDRVIPVADAGAGAGGEGAGNGRSAPRSQAAKNASGRGGKRANAKTKEGGEKGGTDDENLV